MFISNTKFWTLYFSLYKQFKIFSFFKATYSIIQYTSNFHIFALHIIVSRTGFLFRIRFRDRLYTQLIYFLFLLGFTAVRHNMVHSDHWIFFLNDFSIPFAVIFFVQKTKCPWLIFLFALCLPCAYLPHKISHFAFSHP